MKRCPQLQLTSIGRHSQALIASPSYNFGQGDEIRLTGRAELVGKEAPGRHVIHQPFT